MMAAKKRRLRATRTRALARVARSSLRQNRRFPLRWGSTELKFLDCAWNGVGINTSTDGANGEIQPSSGCTNAISVPAQGDGESNRDGRKYTVKSVFLSGSIAPTVQPDQADADADCGYYLALVLDTQANGATIVSENVFINPGTSTQAIAPQPLRNLQNSKRYRILASTYVAPQGVYGFTDGANTASINAQNILAFSLSWKGNIVCDSTGTTANVTSASDNAIHLVGYNCGGFVASVNAKSRVRFVG